ncbi:AAA protein, partial [Gryllus bimaculatus]
MPFCGCLKKPTSLEDLLKHKKVKELKVKTPRSKVNMRIVIKCNSPVVFIVGPPGVGKKRQANAIAKRFGYVHFDVPDLVKVEAMQNTPREAGGVAGDGLPVPAAGGAHVRGGGVKIPSRLREHLIMFGEHLMPLLAAYDDRVEQVVLVENEDL